MHTLILHFCNKGLKVGIKLAMFCKNDIDKIIT